MVNKDVGLY